MQMGSAMYTIELTRGAAWDAPVVEEHSVRPLLHISDVERMAQSMLNRARVSPKASSPTDYRVVDALGRCVRSSYTNSRTRSYFLHAGRTCWS
jgi:hypothetical protein